VEKKQFDLCLEILRRFNSQGLLEDVILIGSWCIPFYIDYFGSTGMMDVSQLKTRDVDFLIPSPYRLRQKVDIPALVKDLGFVTTFIGQKGYMKLDHPDLIIEFLVPERGKGADRPIPLPALGVNASALRYLTMLLEKTISVRKENFIVKLPHPSNFALHKLVISQRRATKEKADKDHLAAIHILEALIKRGDATIVKRTFDSYPPKWRKRILHSLDQRIHGRILSVLQP